MGDYDDDNEWDDIIDMKEPIIKYLWRVVLEIPQHVQTVEANTAEEAMKIAEDNFQLKEFGIDRLPPMICTEAQIKGLTPRYEVEMKGYKDANQPPF